MAEHAVSGVLGASDTVLGGAARAAAKAATRGIVEGGLFGAGQGISESTLDNQPLTAEKLFSSIGHGSLMGGLLGGAVGGAGNLAAEGASHLLGGFSEKLDEAAGEQAVEVARPAQEVQRPGHEARGRHGRSRPHRVRRGAAAPRGREGPRRRGPLERREVRPGAEGPRQEGRGHRGTPSPATAMRRCR